MVQQIKERKITKLQYLLFIFIYLFLFVSNIVKEMNSDQNDREQGQTAKFFSLLIFSQFKNIK